MKQEDGVVLCKKCRKTMVRVGWNAWDGYVYVCPACKHHAYEFDKERVVFNTRSKEDG